MTGTNKHKLNYEISKEKTNIGQQIFGKSM